MNSQPQVQNGGFVSVPNEDAAKNYPVAPGNSVTFKDENAPYIYTKTMGFSQLDRPMFEKYKLVREEVETQNGKSEKSDLTTKVAEDLQSQIDDLWSEIDAIREQTKKPVGKREKNGDD
jgi:hypothetical protein